MLNRLKKILFSARSRTPQISKTQEGLQTAESVRGDENANHKNRGNALLGEGKLEAAVACYRKALDLTPDDADIYINLGFVLLKQGQAAEAGILLKKAVVLDVQNADAFYLLGMSASHQGDLKQAIGHYRQALVLKSDFEAVYRDLCLALFQDGQIGEARIVVSQGISFCPRAADLHYYSGNLYASENNHEQAITCFRAALSIQPEYAEVLNSLGMAQQALGDFSAAAASLGSALSLKPDSAEAFNRYGLLLRKLKRHDEALVAFGNALELQRDNVDVLNNRCITLDDLGRFEEALEGFEHALRLYPEDFILLKNLANVLAKIERYEEALSIYDRVLKFQPQAGDILCNRGVVLGKLGRTDEELETYDLAIRFNPGMADLHYNQGNALQRLERFQESLESYDEALRIQPEHGDALGSRGNSLRFLNRIEEALASFDQSLRLMPESASTWNYRGAACADIDLHEQALKDYAMALRFDPDHADAHFNESLSQLALGNFEAGWQKYEWRWQVKALKEHQRRFAQPLWLGVESLAGKTILLHSEQGFGDILQFCRYAKLVSALGAAVLLEVPAALKSLITPLDGVSRLLVRGEPLPRFDYHCPLMSLPLAFKSDAHTIPAGTRYLYAAPDMVPQWQARLGNLGGKRIGLIWSGRPAHKNDRNRSIPLEKFIGLACLQAHYVCLQKELRAEDREVLDRFKNISYFGDYLTDFAETAALISQMDLVISVDTSVAHLAGAMGTPVWLLLPLNADWRWLRSGNESSWYPSARLFRQTKTGDWDSVISAVASEQKKWNESGHDVDMRPGHENFAGEAS